MNIQRSVAERYAAGAQAREAALCCPVDYDPQFLKAIPQEVLERDYGCGDPSRYVRSGETVLDLGSGGGKICFIASQIVGESGRVIGVDMTPDMLALARANAPAVAQAIGYGNIEFRRGHIQDLRTDLDAMDGWLKENPVSSADDHEKLEAYLDGQRREAPLIADKSVDVIVSNCVLNLVDDTLKTQLFAEMHRVLRVGGRIAISDIVSDEVSPPNLKDDKKLWSGCISGALQEHEFLTVLAAAGFHGMTIDKYEPEPWQIVDGIEYRSVTVLAWRGEDGPAVDKNQAAIYKGPWKTVEDDAGNIFHRGERMAVSDKTFRVISSEPYAGEMIAVPPAVAVAEDKPFACCGTRVRRPEQTKAGKERLTTDPDQCCGDAGCC